MLHITVVYYDRSFFRYLILFIFVAQLSFTYLFCIFALSYNRGALLRAEIIPIEPDSGNADDRELVQKLKKGE